MNHRNRARRLAPLLALAPLAACSPEFQPVVYLDDLRVLAIPFDPVEIGPEESITLSPVVYVPEGEAIVTQSWSFCPFSLGPQAAYECAVPQCEITLEPEPDGSITTSPGLLALECLDRVGQDLDGSLPGPIGEIPERLEVYFRYTVEDSSGLVREAVARPAVWPLGVPEPRNRNPVIAGVEVDGELLEAGVALEPRAEGEVAEVRVRVDEASLDRYVDPSGAERTEEPIWSFFSTAGRFEYHRLAGNEVSQSWKARSLRPEEHEAELYVVLRDLRGGQAVAGPFVIPIEREGG